MIWSTYIIFFAECMLTACKQARFHDCYHPPCSYCQALVFSAIRIFAIWRQSYAWACTVLLLGIVPVATNLVSLFHCVLDFHLFLVLHPKYTNIGTTYQVSLLPVPACWAVAGPDRYRR